MHQRAAYDVTRAAKRAVAQGQERGVNVSSPELRQKESVVSVSTTVPFNVSALARDLPGATVYARGDVCAVGLDVYYDPRTLRGAKAHVVSPLAVVASWLLAFIAYKAS